MGNNLRDIIGKAAYLATAKAVVSQGAWVCRGKGRLPWHPGVE